MLPTPVAQDAASRLVVTLITPARPRLATHARALRATGLYIPPPRSGVTPRATLYTSSSTGAISGSSDSPVRRTQSCMDWLATRRCPRLDQTGVTVATRGPTAATERLLTQIPGASVRIVHDPDLNRRLGLSLLKAISATATVPEAVNKLDDVADILAQFLVVHESALSGRLGGIFLYPLTMVMNQAMTCRAGRWEECEGLSSGTGDWRYVLDKTGEVAAYIEVKQRSVLTDDKIPVLKRSGRGRPRSEPRVNQLMKLSKADGGLRIRGGQTVNGKGKSVPSIQVVDRLGVPIKGLSHWGHTFSQVFEILASPGTTRRIAITSYEAWLAIERDRDDRSIFHIGDPVYREGAEGDLSTWQLTPLQLVASLTTACDALPPTLLPPALPDSPLSSPPPSSSQDKQPQQGSQRSSHGRSTSTTVRSPCGRTHRLCTRGGKRERMEEKVAKFPTTMSAMPGSVASLTTACDALPPTLLPPALPDSPLSSPPPSSSQDKQPQQGSQRSSHGRSTSTTVRSPCGRTHRLCTRGGKRERMEEKVAKFPTTMSAMPGFRRAHLQAELVSAACGAARHVILPDALQDADIRGLISSSICPSSSVSTDEAVHAFISLDKFIASGRLWDAYRGSLKIPGVPALGVVAKVLMPHTFSDGTATYGSTAAAKAAHENEVALLEGPLRRLQGEAVPRRYGGFKGYLRASEGYREVVRLHIEVHEDVGESAGGEDGVFYLSRDERLCIEGLYHQLHDASVVHNDVEQRHIMRRPDGRFAIVDFEGSELVQRGEGEVGDAKLLGELKEVRDLLGLDDEEDAAEPSRARTDEAGGTKDDEASSDLREDHRRMALL